MVVHQLLMLVFTCVCAYARVDVVKLLLYHTKTKTRVICIPHVSNKMPLTLGCIVAVLGIVECYWETRVALIENTNRGETQWGIFCTFSRPYFLCFSHSHSRTRLRKNRACLSGTLQLPHSLNQEDYRPNSGPNVVLVSLRVKE